MPVEDVVIRMGMDARPVSSALRGVRKEFDSFKSDMKGINVGSLLQGIAGGMGVGLTQAALTATAKGAISFAREIKYLAEETGMAGSTIQAFALKVSKTGGTAEGAERGLQKLTLKIGQAKEGTKAAVEAFDRIGISLKDVNGHSKSTETIFNEVADKIKAIEDPTVRAQVAFDLFGKSGIQLVNALKLGSKGLEEFKKASSGKILSDAEIDRLDLIGKKLKGFGSYMMAMTGKLITVFSASYMGDAGTDLLMKKVAADKAAKGGDPIDLEAKGEIAKKTAQALEKLETKRLALARDMMSSGQRIKSFQEESLFLADAIRNSEEGSAEQIELKTARLEVQKNLEDEIAKHKKIQDDFDKKKLDDQEKLNKKKEHELDVLNAINQANDNRKDAGDNADKNRDERGKFNLQDLANLRPDRNTTNDMRNQIWRARDIQNAEARARNLAAHGYDKESKDLFNKADEARAGLTALNDHDRFPNKEVDKALIKSEAHLAELIRKAGAEGINIVPKNGK